MKWSEETWKEIENIYNAIIEMPFIEELSKGTLAKDKFQFYMLQDTLYLEQYGRVLAHIASKISDNRDALAFIGFSEVALVQEKALHNSYFKDFEVEQGGVIQPACHHYIHFLKGLAAFESVEVAMAGVLPCFWIYQKVGEFILKRYNAEGNPYKDWIQTYGGEEFGLAVDSAINICNKAAENTTKAIRTKMTEAFFRASQMEYDFWNAAYIHRVWKFEMEAYKL